MSDCGNFEYDNETGVVTAVKPLTAGAQSPTFQGKRLLTKDGLAEVSLIIVEDAKVDTP